MSLFWFSDEPGHIWEVILASTEEAAWKILAANSFGDNHGSLESGIPTEEARAQFELTSVTELAEEGSVAVIFPLECNFSIRSKTGD